MTKEVDRSKVQLITATPFVLFNHLHNGKYWPIDLPNEETSLQHFLKYECNENDEI